MRVHIPNRHPQIGNSFGYSRVAEEMRAALQVEGGYVDKTPSADAVVHITPPTMFQPVAGILNVLFTMFEAEILPPEFGRACAAADAVIVPSCHNQRVFNAAGIDVAVCPLGIDPAQFHLKPRRARRKDERFRFLWVGAPNPRKGWRILERTWYRYFARDPRVELYVKTTTAGGGLERCGNVIADSRPFSDAQLANLYGEADCFVFPSYGEGFGLTLAEAMATGLPSIFTPYGGVCDFADSKNGYPLAIRMVPVDYFGVNFAAAAEPDDLADKMYCVIREYERALMKGRAAAAQIAKNLTWRHAALKLLRLIEGKIGSPLESDEAPERISVSDYISQTAM